MKRIAILLNLLLALCVKVQADICGPWHGEISIGTQRLPIVINISNEDNELSVTLDSPAQGAKDIPGEIIVDADTVRIMIPMIGARYESVCHDGMMEGTFRQNGMSFPLKLLPGEYVAPRPQTPVPPYPYKTEELEICNPADSTILHATLTLPVQYSMYPNRRFPAVVFITGSGVQDRDETVYGHKPFAVMAHHLAMNGIASLRYDDRGYGGEDISNATTETYASDAAAVLKYARDSVARITKVGAIGHSEGGTISLMLGAAGDADFIISLAGPAVRGDSILIEQNRRILTLTAGGQIADEYTRALTIVLKYMEEHPDATEWDDMPQALAGLTNLTPEMIENLRNVIAGRVPWLDRFLTFDPSDYISAIKVPVMAVNGGLDTQVDATINLGAIRQLLPENPKSLIKEYPGLNHLLQHATTGLPTEYGSIEETISPDVLNDIYTWIKSIK